MHGGADNDTADVLMSEVATKSAAMGMQCLHATHNTHIVANTCVFALIADLNWKWKPLEWVLTCTQTCMDTRNTHDI